MKKGSLGVAGVLMGIFMCFGIAGLTEMAAAEEGYLKLPDNSYDPVIVYVDPGEKPNINHLTKEEVEKLTEWLQKKSATTKAGDIVIEYREKSLSSTETEVEIFQPAKFSGKAKVGGLGQELTDGRLTLKVGGVKKEIYASFGGSELPYQYVASCVFGNPGTSEVKVNSLTYYFFEPGGKLGAAMERKAVKQNGNVISEATEPQIYKPGAKEETDISSSGTCVKLNNICLKISYADGTETLFAIYVPAEKITDK